MELSEKQLQALKAGKIKSKQVVENRGYVAIYYAIWAELPGGEQVHLDEVGPYKHAYSSSLYYDPEWAKSARSGAKAERDFAVMKLKEQQAALLASCA